MTPAPRGWPALLALAACGIPDQHVGRFTVHFDDDLGRFTVFSADGQVLQDVGPLVGAGTATIDMEFGAFRVTDEEREVYGGASFGTVFDDDNGTIVAPLVGHDGYPLGDLLFASVNDHALAIDFQPYYEHDRVGFSAVCGATGAFLGLGAHALDVDHRGESFALWTSEPGIGKSDTDELPPTWPIEGPRHATSFPVPWVLRTAGPGADGVLVDSYRRVDVDLCDRDPTRFQLLAWDEGNLHLLWVADDGPLEVVRGLTDVIGRAPLAEPWVYGAWSDAIRGPDRVRTVRDELRANGVPASVIWTEDWKGATDTIGGYRLSEEWHVDRDKYPDPEGLAAELAGDGFQWLAYFAPFLGEGTDAWDDALAADVIVEDAAGEPYVFTGVTLGPTALLDLSTDAGQQFAIDRMRDALDLGFDGWMADYGEWLPADAVMANGMTGLQAHAVYPEWWQATNLAAIEGYDATFFVRSGWTRTGAAVPVVWGGDQRTDFLPDDGLPTVLPLALGLSAAGVPVFTHDVAGYQSIGNPPSDQELWFRWASLGAYSPIYRTHHGSFDTANHQFDTNPETLAHYAATTREYARLFPYRYGLAAQAARDGTPMILPIGFVFPGEDVTRMDAWMLGSALLVAPVLERGATSRDVDLPDAVAWWDWRTLTPAASGAVDAPVDSIPVFAAAHTTIPTFATIPDTLLDSLDGGLGLRDVDGERVVYLIGGGGPFTEADGTTYQPDGEPTGSGEVEATLRSGEVEVVGVRVTVDGPVERTYRFVVP